MDALREEAADALGLLAQSRLFVVPPLECPLPIYSPRSPPTANARHPAAQLWHRCLFRRPTVRSGCCVRCCLRFVGYRNYRHAHASKPLPTACRERTEDVCRIFSLSGPVLCEIVTKLLKLDEPLADVDTVQPAPVRLVVRFLQVGTVTV